MAYLECENLVVETWDDGNIILQINKYYIATICLNRIDKHNALSANMVTGLNNALDYLEYYNDHHGLIRILILRANGPTFCAGADLKLMQQMVYANYDANCADAQSLAIVLKKFSDFPAPTIALVQGNAYGGGVGLICCADYALAIMDAKFCLSEVKLGIIPAIISPYLLDTIGYKDTLRLFMSAQEFDSLEGRGMNMFSELANDYTELNSKLENLVHLLIKNAPQAVRKAKKIVKQLNKNSNLADINLSELIAQIRISEEGQEGLLAFLEKRTPKWIIPQEGY